MQLRSIFSSASQRSNVLISENNLSVSEKTYGLLLLNKYLKQLIYLIFSCFWIVCVRLRLF